VESYDATTQKASVQPLIKRGYYDEKGGVRQAESLPIITGVPVLFPGGGGCRITWPIAVGDTVLLVFSEASLDKWVVTGGEVDPRDDRRHSLSDAVAIPGLRPFKNATAADGTNVVIEAPAEIHAGGSSALALQAELADLKSRIASWIPVPNDGGASLQAVFSAWPVPGTQVLKGS
jgi:hypothetical protein